MNQPDPTPMNIKAIDIEILKEVFKNFQSPHMARAWRNRSLGTQNRFYRAAAYSLGVYHFDTRLAASLYVACGQLQSSVLDTSQWPEAYWPWLISNWYRFAIYPVNKQLLRGEYIVGGVIKN